MYLKESLVNLDVGLAWVKFHKCPDMSICCYLAAIGLKWCPRAAATYKVDEA